MADYPTSEEIARLKEARELRRERIRDLAKVRERTAEQEALLAKLKTEHEDIGKQLKEQLAIRKELNADLKEEIEALQALVGQYNAIQGSIDARVLAMQTEEALLNKQIELIAKEQEKTGIITENEIARTKELKKQLKLLSHRQKLANQMANASDKTADSIAGLLGISQELNLTWGENLIFAAKQGDILSTFNEKYVKTGRLAASIAEKAAEAAMAYTAMLWANTMAVDAAQSAINKATGAQGKYNDMVQESTNRLRAFGLTAEGMGATVTALHGGFTDFTMINDKTAQSIAETGTVLAELGVKGDDYAASQQIATKMLGMSSNAVEGYARDMTAYAMQIGVAPDTMMAGLARMGPEMAKLDDLTGSYKELARVSKITGMEMQKILNLTNKFDTFEESAETVGRLNALMGGDFVNSMDLMMATDPAERFGMIRDALDNAGLAFDNMSYYQKLAYKEALGLESVGDLALLMSGNFDSLSGSTDQSAADFERLAEEAAKNQEFMDLLKSTFAALAPAMTEIVKKIKPMLIGFAEWVATLDPSTMKMMAAGLVVGLGAIALAFTAIAAAMAASTVSMGVAAPAIAGMAGSVATLAATLPAAAAGQAGLTAANTAATPAATAAAPAMATLGASLLKLTFGLAMVGASIYLAATGIGNLAESFKGLDGTQIMGVAGALIFMGGAVALLAMKASVLAVAAKPMVIFGAALIVVAAGFLMLGAAVALAGIGIKAIATGLAELFKAASVGQLTMFAISMALLGTVAAGIALIAPGAGVGFGIMAAGLLAMSLAMAPMEDSLKALDGLISGLVTLSGKSEGLSKVADSIKTIGQSVKDLPEGAALELTTAMRATSTAATAGATMPAGARSVLPGPRKGKQAVNVSLKLENQQLIKFLKGEFVTYEQMMEAIEGL